MDEPAGDWGQGVWYETKERWGEHGATEFKHTSPLTPDLTCLAQCAQTLQARLLARGCLVCCIGLLHALDMNSLAYLSRQYDVLAATTSSSGSCTPPSTPTDEHAGDLGRRQPGRVGKRTRSWVRDGLLIAGTPDRKQRSKSSPALASIAQQPTTPITQPPKPQELTPIVTVTPVLEETQPLSLQRWASSHWRRTWIMRTWIALWEALAHAWRLAIRARLVEKQHELHRIDSPAPSTSMLASGESSSESEDDPIVARARIPRKSIQPPASIVHESDTEASSPGTDTDSMRMIIPSRRRPPATLLPAPLANYLLSYSPAPTPPLSGAGTPLIYSSRPRPGIHLPKTLVLDLDETLIHSTSRPLHATGGGGGGLLGFGGRRGKVGAHMVEVVLGGRSTLYHVYKRPFVDYFLRKVSSWYTLVIFTASMQEYADPVIDWLDGGRGILVRRLFRESCTQLPSGSYSKDLSIIEPDLARVALVDNSPASYSINQANGIPIEGWTHDQSDEALLDLLPFLDSLRFTSDVRRVLSIRGF